MRGLAAITSMPVRFNNMKYKGFTITEIYQSADGRGNHDYSIVPAIRKDVPFPKAGEVKMKTTVDKIKSLIDKR